MWPIAFSCALFILSLIWPPALDRVSPGAVISVSASLLGSIVAMLLVVHTREALGKPSLEDDEREWALTLSVALFGSLPTLYASWNLRKLPKE